MIENRISALANIGSDLALYQGFRTSLSVKGGLF